MYIALTQPEFPTLKATLNIKPVEQEPMKVVNRYKKFNWDVWYFVTFAWIVVLSAAHLFFHV